MDLPDYTTMVNRRDTFRHDLWGRGRYPSRGKLPNAEDELLHFKQQWWTTREKLRPDWGKKRKSSDPVDLLPLEVQAGIWCQCEVETISTRGLSVEESCGCCMVLQKNLSLKPLPFTIQWTVWVWKPCSRGDLHNQQMEGQDQLKEDI